jgi:hypothetical protein
MLVMRIKGVRAALFCLPYDFKMGDAVDAILAYGQANPAKREMHILVFTWNALKRRILVHSLRWQCKATNVLNIGETSE